MARLRFGTALLFGAALSALRAGNEDIRADLEAGRVSEAFVKAERESKERPNDETLRALWARILIEKKLTERAEPVVRELLRRGENDVSLLIAADWYRLKGDVPRARESVLKVLREDRRNLGALLHLAALEEAAGYPARAFPLYREAGLLREEDPEWLRAYGLFLVRQNRRVELETHVKLFRKYRPKDPVLSLLESLLAQQGGRLDAAMKAVDQALYQEPERAEFLDQKRNLYLAAGKLRELAAFLQKDPGTAKDWLACYQLGWAQLRLAEKAPWVVPDAKALAINVLAPWDRALELDENQEAVRHAAEEAAVRSLPMNHPVREKYAAKHRSLAEALADRGETAKQGLEILRALRLTPESVPDRKAWSDWLKEQGFETSSLEQLRVVRTLTGDPGFLIRARILFRERAEGRSLAARHGVDLTGADFFKTRVVLDDRFAVDEKVLPDIDRIAADIVRERLSQIHALRLETTGGQALDPFLDKHPAEFALQCRVKETPGRLDLQAVWWDARKRLPVARERFVTEGRERWLDLKARLGLWVTNQLVRHGELLRADATVVLLGLGRRDGVQEGDTAEIRAAVTDPDEPPVALAKIVRSDEFLSALELADGGLLRFIKAGDRVRIVPKRPAP